MQTDLLSTISGLYVLTPQGELGRYDDERQFHIDTVLSAALRAHNTHLLERYIGGEGEQTRIGLIYPTRAARPWKTATFFFDEHTVRQLYPMGAHNVPLTTFQKKNQRNSYFRAMEILINARAKETQTMMYCPVVFDSGGTLNQYATLLGSEQESDAETPVVEVLNLVDGLSTARRDTQVLQTIETQIRTILIEREKGRAGGFTLIDNVDFQSSRSKGWDDASVREQGDITLSAEDLDRLHQTQRHEGVERWLEIPHRAVNPGDLRQFVHFRDLNETCLDVLAARTLVYTAPSGTALLEEGMTDKWNLYLLEGTLLLSCADGKTVTVEGRSPKATAPVAFLKPRKYKIIALTKVSFLWVHDAMLHAIREARGNIAPLLSKTSNELGRLT